MTNEHCCEHAGLNPREVTRIARGLSRYAKQAADIGLTVFGGSGVGTLRTRNQLVVADLEGANFDGGDGACREDEDGLMWGESADAYGRIRCGRPS
jgi:hypothetical protein